MKKAKKKVKGMTLIEMIITIMVFTLMCGVLVMIGTHIDSVTKSTNTIKDKIVKQSPYAANNNNTYIGSDNATHTFASNDVDITISWAGGTIDGTNCSGFDVELGGKRYMTEEVVLDGRTEKSKEYIQNGPNAGINLDFIGTIHNKDTGAGETLQDKANVEAAQAAAAAAVTSTTTAAPVTTTVTTT